jgi:hypothetical protein
MLFGQGHANLLRLGIRNIAAFWTGVTAAFSRRWST